MSQFYKNPDGSSLPTGNGLYPSVEFDPHNPNHNVACPYVVYAHGSAARTITIELYNPVSRAISGMFTASQVTFTRTTHSPNVVYTLTPTPASQAISIPSLGRTTVSVDVSGLPDFVCAGSFSLSWEANCEPDDSGGGTIGETLYLVDATPAGWMSTPWAEVLNLACAWADGKSGKLDCLQYCTKGLYHSAMFYYHNDTLNQIDDSTNGDGTPKDSYGKFKLSSMFANASPPAYGWADCRDTSAFLLLCTSALGYDGTLTQVYVPGTDSNGNPTEQIFETNSLLPIGRTGSYFQSDWGFHQFFEASGSSVYDACAAQAVDLSGAAYNEVPFAWARAGFWQTAIGSGYAGLASGLEPSPPNLATPTFGSSLVRGPLDAITSKQILEGVE
ncbi:MAG TPA: hypothetical protein VMI31_06270 [Fimbriimonadaceae bacterium]|nr:hypothetical protein [Fimbriimonadaceae bacterium]